MPMPHQRSGDFRGSQRSNEEVPALVVKGQNTDPVLVRMYQTLTALRKMLLGSAAWLPRHGSPVMGRRAEQCAPILKKDLSNVFIEEMHPVHTETCFWSSRTLNAWSG